MSIENIYGKHGKAVTCDNCGDGFESESWDEAQQIMKEQGWKKRLIDGEYRHFCPDCKEAK